MIFSASDRQDTKIPAEFAAAGIIFLTCSLTAAGFIALLNVAIVEAEEEISSLIGTSLTIADEVTAVTLFGAATPVSSLTIEAVVGGGGRRRSMAERRRRMVSYVSWP
jgi:hypothetical protein